MDNKIVRLRIAIAILTISGLWPRDVLAEDDWTAPPHKAGLPNPLATNSPGVVTMGKTLYKDHCHDCHGSNGRGNGPAAVDLSRRPPDFSDKKVRQQSDGELFWKITEGNRPMPSFSKKLSDEQRWQLVCFLRTLHGQKSKEPAPDGSKPSKRKP